MTSRNVRRIIQKDRWRKEGEYEEGNTKECID
jgi:hypothetical protein